MLVPYTSKIDMKKGCSVSFLIDDITKEVVIYYSKDIVLEDFVQMLDLKDNADIKDYTIALIEVEEDDDDEEE